MAIFLSRERIDPFRDLGFQGGGMDKSMPYIAAANCLREDTEVLPYNVAANMCNGTGNLSLRGVIATWQSFAQKIPRICSE